MAVHRVGGAAYDLGVSLGELLESLLEGVELGGTGGGRIERIEEEHHVLLSPELREREALLDLAADGCLRREIRRLSSDQNAHGNRLPLRGALPARFGYHAASGALSALVPTATTLR